MAYQVYFGDLTEENRALVLTLLRLKEEANALEEGEADLLYGLRGSTTPTPYPSAEEPARHNRQGSSHRSSGRRGNNNGRSHANDSSN
jgi:hypothetical protein